MIFRWASKNDVKRVLEHIKNKFSGLAKVAFSGSYGDLVNKPDIPTVIPDFVGTKAELDAVINDLPVGTIAFVTDDEQDG